MSAKRNFTLFASAVINLTAMQLCLAADLIPDDQWRGIGTLSFVNASGNTESSSLNFMLNMDRLSAQDKWSFYLQDLNSKSTTTTHGVEETSTTAAMWRTGGRYDYNFDGSMFAFAGLALEHDRIKDLSLRKAINLGLGDHMIKNEDTSLDIYSGLNVRNDKYEGNGVIVGDELKATYHATELLLGEEFNYKINESTKVKESLVAYPNFTTNGKYRSIFDLALSVAMTKTLSLTVSFQDRYDDLAVSPIKPNDTLLMVGVSMSLGPK